MAYNPNAIFLSPSSLADFEKCPQLYYLRQVYRSPRGLKIQLINPSLALGQTIHDILDQFLRLLPEQRTKDELERIFDLIWNNVSGEKGGFEPPFAPAPNGAELRRGTGGQEEEYKERGRQMLNRFWNNKHFQMTESVKIPNFPKAELGSDLILTGKLDWVEKFDDSYKIVDFKTGKNEEREDSKQMPIYAYLVSQVLNTNKVTACYWYLDKDEDLTACILPNLEETLAYLRKMGEIIKMVRQTKSFKCQSGREECWACKDMLAVSQGKGKLVSMDPVNRKQEIYILKTETEIETEERLKTQNSKLKSEEKGTAAPTSPSDSEGFGGAQDLPF